jgi:cellulose synthase (UDP-forming)
VNDVAQLVAAWPITRAVALGLFTKGPHKFSVTAKGGDRTKVVVQWPLMRPFLVLFGLTVGGLLVPLQSDFVFNTASTAGDGMVVVLFWTLYNLLVLLVAIAACVERPRPNRPQRQEMERTSLVIGGEEHQGWIVNLGLGGARISGPSGLEVGGVGLLRLAGVGDVSARVIAPTRDGYRLGFDATPDQRGRIIEKLHTAQATPGTGAGKPGHVVRELARVLTR